MKVEFNSKTGEKQVTQKTNKYTLILRALPNQQPHFQYIGEAPPDQVIQDFINKNLELLELTSCERKLLSF